MPEGISIREFARRAGCDEKTVRRKVESRHLPAFTDGSLDTAHVELDWKTGPIQSATPLAPEDTDDGRGNASLVRQILEEEGQPAGDAELTLTHVRMAVGILRAREQSRLNDLARGELVTIDEVCGALSGQCSVIRENFLALPGDMADELAGHNAATIEELLRNKVEEILRELSVDQEYES